MASSQEDTDAIQDPNIEQVVLSDNSEMDQILIAIPEASFPKVLEEISAHSEIQDIVYKKDMTPNQTTKEAQEIAPRNKFYRQIRQAFGNFIAQIGNAILDPDEDEDEELSKNIAQLSLDTMTALFPKFVPTLQNTREDPNIVPSQSLQNDDKLPNLQTTESKTAIEIDLLTTFDEDITDMNEVLDALNAEASKLGYCFKKGPSYKSKDLQYASIYCKYKQRNKKKDRKRDENTSDISDEEDLKDDKGLNIPNSKNKTLLCEAFYRFRYNKETRTYFLNTFDQIHSHKAIDIQKTTQPMIKDLHSFKKKRPIIDILRCLESKYHCTLDYKQVYYEFRKIKPLFGPEDCSNFINYLQSIYSSLEYLVDDSNGLCKFIFATPAMKTNYKLFGDVLLLDATYKTNQYQVPLIAFSGVAKDGKNVLFGIALVNNETYETYSWCLKAFFKLHEDKLPNVAVTDGDLAIAKAVKNHNFAFTHFLCQWHFKRNLNTHFAFLKRNNEDMYNCIMRLPDIETVSEFMTESEIVQTFLETLNSSEKINEYFENILGFKTKWALAYRSEVFSAGVNTTSRAESMNRLIKRICQERF